ncbi:hypothetical protein [Aequorivita nionensis]|uniref:hypothetical protein n=1 Tax=Aequorivita nionensis TaxID=1287690 RepID=UPI003965ABE2
MGTTIGEVLISYDINRAHNEVKTALLSLGYFDNFKYTNESKIYYLPNTTLWHDKKSSDQAMSDLKIICARLGATLEKAIAVNATEFVGI